jgi:uncharacterized protein YjbI with pentapeptide repeats
LSGARLSEALLSDADLGDSELLRADLSGADLSGGKLRHSGFYQADLSHANLSDTGLVRAELSRSNLSGSNFSHANLGGTVFGDVDLTNTIGLDLCRHHGSSMVDLRTLGRSKDVPLIFWRGCGLPDRLIDYLPSIIGEAIQFYSCFISYSSKDQEFADRLYTDLQNNGVRCWFARHDLPIGARTWDKIDEAIRTRDKVLLILSEDAIGSEWVEDEVTKAFAEERRRKETVLFPVRLDGAVMETKEPWAGKLRDNRNIGDFSRWTERGAYQSTFQRLLRDLKVKA